MNRARGGARHCDLRRVIDGNCRQKAARGWIARGRAALLNSLAIASIDA
jgi:hypothetical protein